MKYLVQTFAAALIGVSSNVYAAPVNGINYDPAHSQAWIEAQRGNDEATMSLAQIKRMNFGVIKTFYSRYCTQDGKSALELLSWLNKPVCK
jgi:hypothetical protein